MPCRRSWPTSAAASFRDRTTSLVILGSVAVGVVMFGSMVFLSQYRSLGGAMGVSLLGAVMAHQMRGALAARHSATGGGGSSLDLAALPSAMRELTRTAYADATGTVFAVSAGVAMLSLVASLAIREVGLRATIHEHGDD